MSSSEIVGATFLISLLSQHLWAGSWQARLLHNSCTGNAKKFEPHKREVCAVVVTIAQTSFCREVWRVLEVAWLEKCWKVQSWWKRPVQIPIHWALLECNQTLNWIRSFFDHWSTTFHYPASRSFSYIFHLSCWSNLQDPTITEALTTLAQFCFPVAISVLVIHQPSPWSNSFVHLFPWLPRTRASTPPWNRSVCEAAH